MNNHQDRRAIPSVERLSSEFHSILPRPILIQLARNLLHELRAAKSIPPFSEIVKQLSKNVAALERERLQPIINATGILLHTNLGRAPLSADALQAIGRIASGYCNLEFQLDHGRRGRRGGYLERCLKTLFCCEDVAIVNNCAASLVLILNYILRKKKEVVISRGELLQIGGGFRIPEILESSGATMREIGTTNHTSLGDYERALGEKSGLILVVHRSNFSMQGFVKSPSLRELAALGKARGVPVVYDQGSGATIPMSAFCETELCEIEPEKTVKELLSFGVDLVCLSGDKLFGGPQSGLICGETNWISNLKKHPIYRALRCDKLTLAALQSTTETYLKGMNEISSSIPIYQALSQNITSIKHRAEAIIKHSELSIEVIQTKLKMGGGTLPESQIPSLALTIKSRDILAQNIAKLLREGEPPVIGYVSKGRCCLDLKTVFEEQDALLISSLRTLKKSIEKASGKS